MHRFYACLFCLLIAAPGALRADETVRQVQEELRKRNLYFGNIDGQESPELAGALKRYQKRKGFAVTGSVNEETATSLHVQAATVASADALPDGPVLKSDVASALPEPQRLALQREAEEKADFDPSPPPPAESPGPGQDVNPERVNELVRAYLRDGETQDVAAQVKYYSFPVQYFDHGSVPEEFVARDTRKYVERWPERKYSLTGPVNFFASDSEGETNIEFTISFEVQNKARKDKNRASGRTKNWWTVRAEGGELKIVAIREHRLRE
jgi:peptidoglycan hydrolase-like protein with peptidoglycan-binding domain